MKLSDAILLGSTAVKPMPYGVLLDLPGGPRGCAYGMAIYAIGIKDQTELKNFGGDKVLPKEWRWCKDECRHNLCNCKPHTDPRLLVGNYHGYIAHLFNEHVAKGEMTLERLVDYVRSIEPAERVFQCPSGDCGFVSSQDEVEDHQLTEEEWSDSKTERERFNSITGRS